jgi:hypothetical protein
MIRYPPVVDFPPDLIEKHGGHDCKYFDTEDAE